MENCDDEIDREVNCIIDQILQEDRLESMGLNRCPDSCDSPTEKITIEDSNVNSCAVETSARFSIRILEALRAVQRKKSSDTRPSCTMEEIVQYIRRHYHHDGDLCSQVETALNQVTGQGFVLRTGVNKYHLMGPFACSVLRPPGNCGNQSGCRTPEKSSQCRPRACPRPRSRPCCRSRNNSQSRCGNQSRKRSETPIANSTFASSSGDFQNHSSLDRSQFSAVSNVLDPLQQGINNFEISFVNDPAEAEEFGEDPTVSVVEEVNREVRNESVRRPGGSGGHGGIVREHSSDDFMYCDEPVNEERSRSRSRNAVRGSSVSISSFSSSGSSSSDDTVFSRSGRRPSRRRRKDAFNCSSDADISDEDIDEPEQPSVKPWVRNCQNYNSQSLNRRVHRRCASSACD